MINSDTGVVSKNNVHGKKLKELMRNYRLENVIKDPTRITETTKTLIDVMIVSNEEKIVLSGIIDVGLADQRMTYCILRCQRKNAPPCIMLVTDYKKFDEVDDNLWMVEELYKDVVREAIPKRKAKVRSKSLPWMHSKISMLMNQRYGLLRKAKRTQDAKESDEYKKNKEQSQ